MQSETRFVDLGHSQCGGRWLTTENVLEEKRDNKI